MGAVSLGSGLRFRIGRIARTDQHHANQRKYYPGHELAIRGLGKDDDPGQHSQRSCQRQLVGPVKFNA